MIGIIITIMASKEAKVGIWAPAVIKFGFVEFEENTGTKSGQPSVKPVRQSSQRWKVWYPDLQSKCFVYLAMWIFLCWLSALCAEKHFSHWTHESSHEQTHRREVIICAFVIKCLSQTVHIHLGLTPLRRPRLFELRYLQYCLVTSSKDLKRHRGHRTSHGVACQVRATGFGFFYICLHTYCCKRTLASFITSDIKHIFLFQLLNCNHSANVKFETLCS